MKNHLIRSLSNSDRAANICRPSSIDNTVVDNKVAHRADGIIQGSFSLVDDLII